MMQLPADIDPVYFDTTYRLQPRLWQGAVSAICRQAGLAAADIRAFRDGSNLVAAVDDRYVVKIFPAFHRHQWESEYRVLEHLNRHTRLPVPELIASGEWPEGWTFVIISRLPGVTLEDIWPDLTPDAKAGILFETGRWMAEVHALPAGALLSLEPDWSTFITRQKQHFMARLEKQQLPEWFMAQVRDYVDEHYPLLPEAFTPVLLTGEYTPFNLMAESANGSPRLSAMIDFGDAMTGFREYDLLGPSVFLCGGQAALIRSLFQGYGYPEGRIDADLRNRLMLLLILHRYSHLRVQVRIPGWESRVDRIEELARLIWPAG